MKIKEGKKIWFIFNAVFTVLMLVGTIGAFITKGDFDTFNLIIIFLLVSNMVNCTEKADNTKKDSKKKKE